MTAFGFSRDEFARILPFVAFIFLLALQPWIDALFIFAGFKGQFAYTLRCLVAIALLAYFRRDYTELFPKPNLSQLLLAVLVGMIVFALWIAPYPDWLGGQSAQTKAALPLQTPADVFWIACRWLGSALVVPVIEELFWRSYFIRRQVSTDFLAVNVRTLAYTPVFVGCVLFAVEHSNWFAGFLAGLLYFFLYRHTKLLWPAIVAHITTNGLLGYWVVYHNHWQYW